MAKYDVTRACGHEEVVILIGKNSDREWRLESVEPQKLCRECWEVEKQRKFDEANAKALTEAVEMDLPVLTGSEKQVAWANTLRQAWIDTANSHSDKGKSNIERLKESQPEKAADVEKALLALLEAIDRVLKSKVEARYWIDSRDSDVSSTLAKMVKDILAEGTKPEIPTAVKQGAMEDMTMRPPAPVTPLVTEIRIKEDLVTAKLPEKNEEFRQLARGLKFSWENGCWQRKTNRLTGSSLDRAAELGVKLLAAGFPIRVFQDDLQQRIISGTYDVECTSWVQRSSTGAYGGWFVISWDKEDDFYKAAKKIAGSKYDKPFVAVPPESYEEVMDFARMYEFKLSEGAQEIAASARAAKEAAMVVKVAAKPKRARKTALLKPSELEVPVEVEIADEFMDSELNNEYNHGSNATSI